jgi:phosphinothricin acetyltransferase
MSNPRAAAVRVAEAEDMAAVCAIMNHYIATSIATFRTEPYEVEEWTAQLEARSGRYPWLVAEADGEVVGLAYAGPWNPRGAYAWTAEATVYVADGRHGRGLGSLLYGDLLKRLEQQGFRSVMAQVSRPNPGSEALHAAFGFERLGVIRDAGYKHGAWHDVGIWQRELAVLGDPPPPTLPAG